MRDGPPQGGPHAITPVLVRAAARTHPASVTPSSLCFAAGPILPMGRIFRCGGQKNGGVAPAVELLLRIRPARGRAQTSGYIFTLKPAYQRRPRPSY